MSGLPPQPEPEIGGVYRDVDGSLVRLVAVENNICCWVPQSCASDSHQMSHRDNFVRRFVQVRLLSKRRPKTKRPHTEAVGIAVKAA